MIVFILGLGIESVSGLCANFPRRVFGVVELISGNVIGAFRGLFPVTVHEGHLFGHELLGLCISGGCAERKLRGGGFS